MRRTRFSALAILIVLAAIVGFVAWTERPAAPMPEALAAMASDEQVDVQTEPWLIFRPAATQPEVGLVFYPGGLIDPRAYAPAARAVAAKGYLVVIVPMPFNLALLGSERAAEVIAAFPNVRPWAVGGHSLGGVSAASFAKNHPAIVQGLVLWASYSAEGDNLSGRDLAVVSIYGTQDGLANPGKIAASRARLPAGTRWVAITGGNHGQFGWYGPQSGDGVALISREAQQEQVVEATADLLALLDATDETRAGVP